MKLKNEVGVGSRSKRLRAIIIDPTSSRINDVYALRYKIFHKQLDWIPENDIHLDFDEYDAHSHNICITDGLNILATARVTPPDSPFMIESDFAYLFEDGEQKKFLNDLKNNKNSSIEISRLALSPDIDDKKRKKLVAISLYRQIYRYCTQHNIQYIYFVSTEKYLNFLAKKFGISIKKISATHKTGRGFDYYAGVINTDFLKNPIQKIKFLIRFFIKN